MERFYTTRKLIPTKSPGYWKDLQNQKAFFDQLAIKWNIQKLDDWNKFTQKMACREGGGSFINKYYNSSLQKGIDVPSVNADYFESITSSLS